MCAYVHICSLKRYLGLQQCILMYPSNSGVSATMLLLLAASLALASASLPSLPRGGEAAQDKSTGNCPDKWVDATFVDMGCLYFNNAEALTWDDASSMCQMGSNSTLLEITTEMQLAFIQMELAVIEDHEDTNYTWWTAARDVEIGQWIWITSLTAVEDFMWWTGYPSTADNYNCMYLHYSDEYLGVNAPCDNTCHPICQLK